MNNQTKSIKIIADDDYFETDTIRQQLLKLKGLLNMQKPTIKTTTIHNGIKFTVLAYRKLTKQELIETLAHHYRQNTPQKGKHYIIETFIVHDE